MGKASLKKDRKKTNLASNRFPATSIAVSPDELFSGPCLLVSGALFYPSIHPSIRPSVSVSFDGQIRKVLDRRGTAKGRLKTSLISL